MPFATAESDSAVQRSSRNPTRGNALTSIGGSDGGAGPRRGILLPPSSSVGTPSERRSKGTLAFWNGMPDTSSKLGSVDSCRPSSGGLPSEQDAAPDSAVRSPSPFPPTTSVGTDPWERRQARHSTGGGKSRTPLDALLAGVATTGGGRCSGDVAPAPAQLERTAAEPIGHAWPARRRRASATTVEGYSAQNQIASSAALDPFVWSASLDFAGNPWEAPCPAAEDQAARRPPPLLKSLHRGGSRPLWAQSRRARCSSPALPLCASSLQALSTWDSNIFEVQTPDLCRVVRVPLEALFQPNLPANHP